MKQELIYIWINDQRCLKKAEFNFSPKYFVTFDYKNHFLTIKETDNINIFQKGNIVNLSAVIGENGTGKTTLLEFLTSLCCSPLYNEQKSNYQEYWEKENEKEIFLAVFVVDNKIKIINKTKRPVFYDEKEIDAITKSEYIYDNLLSEMTQIYFTNSEYATDSNMYQYDIDHISIHNKALNSVAKNFYNYTVVYGNHLPNDTKNDFDNLQQFLISKKSNKDFQQILDVMFLYRLKKFKRSSEYLGKPIKSVNVSFISIVSFIYHYRIQNPNNKFIASLWEMVLKIKNILNALNERRYNVYQILIINLTLELYLLYDFKCCETNTNSILTECEEFISNIKDNIAKNYYKEAIKEIKYFDHLIDQEKIIASHLPNDDLAYREWYSIDVSKLGKFFNRWKNNKCVSFLAKYINIEGLEVSSGERALLNFSSRIEMLDYLSKLEGRNMYKPRKNILLLLDEIDLYVHPNAQKQLILSLTKQINSLFYGHNVQIIISSHSPIVLSDIPSENTIYLIKNKETDVIACNGREREQTFAANISTLYRNSFFIEGGIGIGDYALNFINNIANKLSSENRLTEPDIMNCKKAISLIGEPVLKKKLEEMASKYKSEIINHQDNHLKNKNYEYLSFLRKQRDLINAEIKKMEKEIND